MPHSQSISHKIVQPWLFSVCAAPVLVHAFAAGMAEHVVNTTACQGRSKMPTYGCDPNQPCKHNHEVYGEMRPLRLGTFMLLEANWTDASECYYRSSLHEVWQFHPHSHLRLSSPEKGKSFRGIPKSKKRVRKRRWMLTTKQARPCGAE